MSVDISLVAANLRLDAISAEAGNAARLRIYSGTRPASVAAAISGTLLAELVCGTPFAPAASGGQLKVAAISDDVSADANGTATHFRLFKADGTTAVLDGSVGAHGDLTADLTVGDVVFVVGTPVQIASWRISASGYRWWDNATLFDFDPFNGRGVVDKVPSLPGGMTATTRSGEARQASANGVWQRFVSNVLSLTNDIGAGIFGAFTNKIRNPRGEGGVVGTVGVTNKCTGYNAAPPALVPMGSAAAFNSAVTNTTANGGDGSTLFGVVDDTAALQSIAATDPFIAVGLANGWLNGRVFKIDNSAGAVPARLYAPGGIGATGDAVFSAYVRGSGLYGFHSGYAASANFALTGDYVRKTWVDTVGTGGALRVFYGGNIPAGATLYIILFQMELASAAAPVPTVVAGAAATAQLPTNWVLEANMSGTVASYLGQGVSSDGRPVVDLSLNGTLTGAASMTVRMDGISYATAAAGQAWGLDFGSNLQSGTAAGIASVKARIMDSTGATVADSAENGLSGTATRLQAKGVVVGSATSVYPRIIVSSLNNGATVAATLRIYAPKLVQLAVIEGAEGISNSGPFVNTTGWAQGDPQSILSAASGNLKIENGDASAAYAVATVATVVGAACKVSYNKAVGASAGRVLVRDGGGTVFDTGSSVAGAGVAYFVARQTSTEIVLTNGSDATLAYFSAWSLASAKLVTPGYMPAFPILPPVGTPGDSTHNGDVVKAIASGGDPFAGAGAAGIASGLSLAGIETISHIGDGVIRPLAEMSDGSANNRLRVYIDTDDKLTAAVVSGGVTLATAKLASALAAGELVWAANFDPVNGLYLVRKTGLQNASASLGALPAGLSEFRIGSSVSGNFMNDTKKRQQVRRLMSASEANAWVAAA